MRNRKTWKKGAAVVVAGMLMSSVALVSAQGPRGRPIPPGAGGPGALPPGLMRINLTEQQKTELRTPIEQDRQSRKAQFEQVRTLRQQLNAAVFGGTADMQQLSELTAQLADLQRQALEADIALQVRIAALLTDEQRQQVATARAPQARQ